MEISGSGQMAIISIEASNHVRGIAQGLTDPPDCIYIKPPASPPDLFCFFSAPYIQDGVANAYTLETFPSIIYSLTHYCPRASLIAILIILAISIGTNCMFEKIRVD